MAQQQKQQGSAAGTAIVLFIGICLAFAAKDGAFDGIGKGGGTTGKNDRITYRYDCTFEDFYGGVEMASWEGSGRHHQNASPDPFGALSRSAGTQPKGITLNLAARSLTPNVPLPAGAKPRLECKIVRVDETTGKEKTIRGPQHITSRRVFIQMSARA